MTDAWVLVPREPTAAMVSAAGGALKSYIDSLSPEDRVRLRPRKARNGDSAGYKIAPKIKAMVRWSAMIAAAPKAEGLDAGPPSEASTPNPSLREEMVEALRSQIERLKRDIMEMTCGDPGLVSEATKTDRVRMIANEMFRQAGYSTPMTRWQQEEYESRARALLSALTSSEGSPTRETGKP